MVELLEEHPVLVVPGIGDSGPQHWQSIWQRRYGSWRRVLQRDWARPRREEWVDVFHRAVKGCDAPPVVVAHSLGCLTVVHWACAHALPLRAAFLVAVPDPSAPQFPAEASGFHPLPREPLPWPTLVVTSQDDPYGSASFARSCAATWGGDLAEIGAAGHINAESGHGEWPEGVHLLWTFLARPDRRLAS